MYVLYILNLCPYPLIYYTYIYASFDIANFSLLWNHTGGLAPDHANNGVIAVLFMMTLSNGKIFHVTGHLCGELTGFRWIPRTKASDAELWFFLWSAPE